VFCMYSHTTCRPVLKFLEEASWGKLLQRPGISLDMPSMHTTVAGALPLSVQ
jgi:hypothetical protein